MLFLTGMMAFFIIISVLFYHRASLIIVTISLALFLSFETRFIGFTTGIFLCWIIFLLCFIPLNISRLRYRLFSRHLFNFYQRVMPVMSRTERQAISAGTVTWEGDLFRGR